MTDRPILFSAPMVRALLAGTKTQTRRIIKPQPLLPWDALFHEDSKWWTGDSITGEKIEDLNVRFSVGDRLWVRETWGSKEADHVSCCHYEGYRKPMPGDTIPYQADPDSAAQWGPGLPSQGGFMWRPSIHMPRWASRLTLTVVDVRAERLTWITPCDAIDEGVERIDDPRGTAWKSYQTYPDGKPSPHAIAPNRSPLTSFRELWQMINGHESCAENPWVAAVTFSAYHCNIDAMVHP